MVLQKIRGRVPAGFTRPGEVRGPAAFSLDVFAALGGYLL
jgi:hypothetical protein